MHRNPKLLSAFPNTIAVGGMPRFANPIKDCLEAEGFTEISTDASSILANLPTPPMTITLSVVIFYQQELDRRFKFMSELLEVPVVVICGNLEKGARFWSHKSATHIYPGKKFTDIQEYLSFTKLLSELANTVLAYIVANEITAPA